MDARAAEVICLDALRISIQPMDLRAGADRLLAQESSIFDAVQAYHGYLFESARANRVKRVVHEGFGVWHAARRLTPAASCGREA
jgi:hypothetical protein